jgi:hypothetical protein
MRHPAYEPPRGPADPFAVALGNATPLGIGYLLLRQRRLAAIAVLGAAVLVDLTARTAGTRYEILLLA